MWQRAQNIGFQRSRIPVDLDHTAAMGHTDARGVQTSMCNELHRCDCPPSKVCFKVMTSKSLCVDELRNLSTMSGSLCDTTAKQRQLVDPRFVGKIALEYRKLFRVVPIQSKDTGATHQCTGDAIVTDCASNESHLISRHMALLRTIPEKSSTISHNASAALPTDFSERALVDVAPHFSLYGTYSTRFGIHVAVLAEVLSMIQLRGQGVSVPLRAVWKSPVDCQPILELVPCPYDLTQYVTALKRLSALPFNVKPCLERLRSAAGIHSLAHSSTTPATTVGAPPITNHGDGAGSIPKPRRLYHDAFVWTLSPQSASVFDGRASLQLNVLLSKENIVRRVLFQLLRCVSKMHQSGVVHRDIKPGNILVNNDGCVVLCDFGAARISENVHIQYTVSALAAMTAMIVENRVRLTTPKSQYKTSTATTSDVAIDILDDQSDLDDKELNHEHDAGEKGGESKEGDSNDDNHHDRNSHNAASTIGQRTDPFCDGLDERKQGKQYEELGRCMDALLCGSLQLCFPAKECASHCLMWSSTSALQRVSQCDTKDVVTGVHVSCPSSPNACCDDSTDTGVNGSSYPLLYAFIVAGWNPCAMFHRYRQQLDKIAFWADPSRVNQARLVSDHMPRSLKSAIASQLQPVGTLVYRAPEFVIPSLIVSGLPGTSGIVSETDNDVETDAKDCSDVAKTDTCETNSPIGCRKSQVLREKSNMSDSAPQGVASDSVSSVLPLDCGAAPLSAVDLWSVGAVALQLWTGVLPSELSTKASQIFEQRRRRSPTRRSKTMNPYARLTLTGSMLKAKSVDIQTWMKYEVAIKQFPVWLEVVCAEHQMPRKLARLIKRLLHIDPSSRATAQEVLDDSWFDEERERYCFSENNGFAPSLGVGAGGGSQARKRKRGTPPLGAQLDRNSERRDLLHPSLPQLAHTSSRRTNIGFATILDDPSSLFPFKLVEPRSSASIPKSDIQRTRDVCDAPSPFVEASASASASHCIVSQDEREWFQSAVHTLHSACLLAEDCVREQVTGATKRLALRVLRAVASQNCATELHRARKATTTRKTDMDVSNCDKKDSDQSSVTRTSCPILHGMVAFVFALKTILPEDAPQLCDLEASGINRSREHPFSILELAAVEQQHFECTIRHNLVQDDVWSGVMSHVQRRAQCRETGEWYSVNRQSVTARTFARSDAALKDIQLAEIATQYLYHNDCWYNMSTSFKVESVIAFLDKPLPVSHIHTTDAGERTHA